MSEAHFARPLTVHARVDPVPREVAGSEGATRAVAPYVSLGAAKTRQKWSDIVSVSPIFVIKLVHSDVLSDFFALYFERLFASLFSMMCSGGRRSWPISCAILFFVMHTRFVRM